ncbi:MAG TPA: hypothetical protein VIL90_07785 [Puia sp.]
MSRALLTALIVFSFFAADAQFNKGDVLIGGNLFYSSNKQTPFNDPNFQKSNNGYYNLSIGKSVSENKVFGVNLFYQSYARDYQSGYGIITDKMDNYGIGIFFRQYKNLGKEFYIFGELAGGYSGSTSSSVDSTGKKISTGTGYGGSISITPGIAYKISKHFMLEITIPQIFSAAYSSSKTKSGSATIQSGDSFGINTNISSNPLTSLGIGFRLII